LRAFFDTSVLIPVFIEDHEHHERSLKASVDADRANTAIIVHHGDAGSTALGRRLYSVIRFASLLPGDSSFA
jgi:hypothetical protein